MNKQTRIQYRYKVFASRNIILAIICTLGLLPAQEVAAANGCNVTMSDINFGKINVIDPNQPLEGLATVKVSCSRGGTPNSIEKVNVCLAADGGSSAQTRSQINPRYLCENGTCGTNNRLEFNIYTDPNHSKILGSPNYNIKNTINTIVTIEPGKLSSDEVDIPVYARLNAPLSNVTPGIYKNVFSQGSTAVAYETVTNDTAQNCTSRLQSIRFDFNVLAEVEKNCIINKPQDIAFGTVNSTATNLEGQTAVNVTCTQGVPYNVKLEPSNQNTNGSGEMASTRAGNPDRVPYQLRSGSGMNGKIWGNIALGASNNTISGNGSGQTQQHKIYATVPSTDYRAGDYRDTVTVKVDY
ncbi:Csu type fimbrial protein [Neisseria montereyensis]|uniref:Spore coat U domain-containing protein n=1 Tax=Neisseria montereyensis TaxID=2973938 RepID=A0ABT2F9S4_9NEIS|nr:spore coat U domain-containing protein [Neisseria montereyensis]MCS4532917.1 spore coat U domain-containing protein [Neisseria montereyensis]